MKRFIIDLSEKDISKRMESITNNKWFMSSANKLSNNAYHSMINSIYIEIGVRLTIFVTNIIKWFYSIKTQYLLEMNELIKHNVNQKHLVISNLSYELSKIGSSVTSCQWCSSVSKYIPGKGYIHARNMDWHLKGLKNKSIIIDYKNSLCGDFSSVTFPGFAGIITGVAKGRFSASVNMMIEEYGFDLLGTPVSILLRDVFETCDNFESALKMLSESNVMSPSFIHLVGVKKGENCVIVLMTKKYKNIVYKNSNKMVITNHIPDTDFDDDEWEVDSVERYDILNDELKIVFKEKDMLSLMFRDPVYNDMTKHTVIMNPKTGYLNVT